MKKKIFFVLSSLTAGGSERVYWLLSQNFNKEEFDVSLVLLDLRDPFFSPELEGIRVVNLNSIRASKSFFKLYKLLKEEKPYAVFTTGGHISTLLSIISCFVKIPYLIGRETSVIDIMVTFAGPRAKILDLFVGAAYRRIRIGVCQSDEVKQSLAKKYHIPVKKLVVIPNPVIPNNILKEKNHNRVNTRIIVVARLSIEKGLFRLLEIFKDLPQNYTLNIAGDGSLRSELLDRIGELNLETRVKLVGQVKDINSFIAKHDLMLLTSYTEGFPNVVIEALSVGIPVVSFLVGGIPSIIKNGFNGYIIQQDDMPTFKRFTIKACNQNWDSAAIKRDVNVRFGIDKVVARYESLIC